MYHIKVAYALIELGTNLWVNPIQVDAVYAANSGRPCNTVIATGGHEFCSDWTIDQVREALKPSNVAKAMENK